MSADIHIISKLQCLCKKDGCFNNLAKCQSDLFIVKIPRLIAHYYLTAYYKI